MPGSSVVRSATRRRRGRPGFELRTRVACGRVRGSRWVCGRVGVRACGRVGVRAHERVHRAWARARVSVCAAQRGWVFGRMGMCAGGHVRVCACARCACVHERACASRARMDVWAFGRVRGRACSRVGMCLRGRVLAWACACVGVCLRGRGWATLGVCAGGRARVWARARLSATIPMHSIDA